MGGGGKTEFTLSIRLCITLQLLMLIVGSDHYIAKSLSRLVPYHSRKGGLGRERQGYQQRKDNHPNMLCKTHIVFLYYSFSNGLQNSFLFGIGIGFPFISFGANGEFFQDFVGLALLSAKALLKRSRVVLKYSLSGIVIGELDFRTETAVKVCSLSSVCAARINPGNPFSFQGPTLLGISQYQATQLRPRKVAVA